MREEYKTRINFTNYNLVVTEPRQVATGLDLELEFFLRAVELQIGDKIRERLEEHLFDSEKFAQTDDYFEKKREIRDFLDQATLDQTVELVSELEQDEDFYQQVKDAVIQGIFYQVGIKKSRERSDYYSSSVSTDLLLSGITLAGLSLFDGAVFLFLSQIDASEESFDMTTTALFLFMVALINVILGHVLVAKQKEIVRTVGYLSNKYPLGTIDAYERVKTNMHIVPSQDSEESSSQV